MLNERIYRNKPCNHLAFMAFLAFIAFLAFMAAFIARRRFMAGAASGAAAFIARFIAMMLG